MPIGRVADGVGSSTISRTWTSRYNRVRAAGRSRFRSASAMANALLISTVSGKVQRMTAGDTLARQAAENRILASRKTRSIVSGNSADDAEPNQDQFRVS